MGITRPRRSHFVVWDCNEGAMLVYKRVFGFEDGRDAPDTHILTKGASENYGYYKQSWRA
jgi:hypothetical protein